MKKRHTRAEIEAILQRRERDGLTYSELSERTGVAPSTLAWWSWRRRREGNPHTYFRDVLLRIAECSDPAMLNPHGWKHHFADEVQHHRDDLARRIVGE